MGNNNRNFILAIVLSIAVLFGWQLLIANPQIERARQQQALEQQQAAEQQAAQQPAARQGGEIPAPGEAPGNAPIGAAVSAGLDRQAALEQTPRVPIRSAALTGSINLHGARIDDLRLNDYRETTEPDSPTIILLSPASGPDGYFAELGWTAAPGTPVPGPDTDWTAEAGAELAPGKPVTLTYDNGAGLLFRRTVSVDEKYMFTVTDTVENRSAEAATITPYGRVTRLGEPAAAGYFILHEGLIGVIGQDGLQEITYKSLHDVPPKTFEPQRQGWLGITDKYWATALIPTPGTEYQARFARFPEGGLRYQADFRGAAVAVAPGGSTEVTNHVFAGAKQVALVNDYRDRLGIDRFDLLIDWGWFYFITKPMFFLLDTFFHLLGNFGLAILAVTVLVKLLFFPLANRSYRSMSAMRKVQPQLVALRERYKDDRVKQQQAMMELYKKEKINPIAGCWPMLLQVPVFFSLYKVLFVTIEMRHAPFFGWIQDLSAPDPTHILNLFGLLPFNPATIPLIGGLLAIGIWPLIMGVTMWLQMRLNPTPPDRMQAMLFNWMPVVFTFMLASFPAGLVIYWAWNNTLSVIQQSIIMRRSGVDVPLWPNIKATFSRKKKPADGGAKAEAPKS